GTEGKLGGQAEVKGVSGTWKDLTDNVNILAGNLTNQVRNIALVTTAVANGDLSQKITVDVKGEILELKNTINTMVDQLNSFAAEVTRVAREVGTEGKLGGQAEVKGVSGTWKDLTDNVNILAGNLTNQVRNIALVTTAVANGDLSQKITVDVKGEILELKNTVNTMVDQLNSFAAEVTRVAREVGTEGKLGGQAEVKGVSGTWKDLTDNVNFMASNLTTQVRGIAKVVTAVANGDLRQKLVVEAKGEIAALADTINSMTDTLGIFAEQVTTVAREVGTEGILGGQARVPNVAGTWKDLTDNVNFMASNLTTQVRGIAKVVTTVANGDLTQKLRVEAKGEIAELADTINSMTDTLGIFAAQVTRVAREVGTDGKLGGQAEVQGVSGTWKDLTDNVNFMANSLTIQVRSISDVATAVTKGDLTRTITVDAQGEVLALKNNVNQMIANLKDTTQQNKDQDWLKTNLARFSGMMQGQKNLESVSRLIMSELTPLVSAHHGVFYIKGDGMPEPVLKLMSSYGYRERKNVANRFMFGEGLVGQCALEKKSILLANVPGDYIQINSGLGEAPPLNIIVLPVLFEGEIMAVIELASFQRFSAIHTTFLDQLMESIGVVLNMITANMRTEELLEQSQSLTQELQSQSKELQSQQQQLKRTNAELEAQAKELEVKASLLASQNEEVEMKNREVELARAALEEKAEQLALSSKYKSEFLANMSHELRTPLNSMLILAKLLSDNGDGNLTERQTEFAKIIYASGGDLLNLINEILDLSKVEAGKMEVDIVDVPLHDVQEYVERTFDHMAQLKGLRFDVQVEAGLPPVVRTDAQRLQQVLRNLLSNAFKFTEAGSVELIIGRAGRGIFNDAGELVPASKLVAFSVTDTGIGIPRNKQNLIFEAFQQADGTTSRKYGGTGLGLSISREITRLLGGRITVESEPGQGSTFTLFLPIRVEDQGLDELPAIPVEARGPEGAVAGVVLQAERPSLSDDRDNLAPEDRVSLIIEDDAAFAGILMAVAREQGFKTLVAQDGDTGLALARKFKPDAVSLDLKLAGLDGWSVLDYLKRDPETRHIPVQVISVMDRHEGASVGAVSYLAKPVSSEALSGAFAHLRDFVNRPTRNLLVVEDDDAQRAGIVEMLGDDEVKITAVATAEEAIAHLDADVFDCVILDLSLPGLSGQELLKHIKQQPRFADLPVIIYTSRDLTRQEESQLRRYASSVITKDPLTSDRLLDETALFLHRVVERLPEAKRKVVLAGPHNQPGGSGQAPRFAFSARGRGGEEGSRRSTDRRKSGRASAVMNTDTPDKDPILNCKVMIVDDDVRNIFALASLLESYGIQVLFSDSGEEALAQLAEIDDVQLILMDVMMPDMDGYQTTQAIRRMERFHDLPIIALTAKAMEGDREKCLAAGASDYITKPVDAGRLIGMIRDWTARSHAVGAAQS
ncbi:MAG: response regulator, partial [Capsulimonadaceae bacterium]